jgi:hypothetical protein
MKHKKLLLIPAVIVIGMGAFGTYFVYSLFQAGEESRIPNYEVGEHRGAEYCASCHRKGFLGLERETRKPLSAQ